MIQQQQDRTSGSKIRFAMLTVGALLLAVGVVRARLNLDNGDPGAEKKPKTPKAGPANVGDPVVPEVQNLEDLSGPPPPKREPRWIGVRPMSVPVETDPIGGVVAKPDIEDMREEIIGTIKSLAKVGGIEPLSDDELAAMSSRELMKEFERIDRQINPDRYPDPEDK